MAQLVLIDEGTYQEGTNEIDDIVVTHEDDVDLSGGGYSNMKVVRIPNVKKAQIQECFRKIQPEVKHATRAKTTEWTLELAEDKQVWKNSEGKWCDLINAPAHLFSFAQVSNEARAILEDPSVNGATKILLLESQIKEKISFDNNNLIEVTELNRVAIEI